MDSIEQTTGVILAGGESRRMGGEDKGLRVLGGRPMIEQVIDALRPQVGSLLINANRNIKRYQAYGYPVLPDADYPGAGPLAGILSALRAAETPLLATVPCDTPFLPADLVARLYDAMITHNAPLACAHDGQRLQPVFALMRLDVAESLEDYLQRGGRRVRAWIDALGGVAADFSDRPQAFFNINTPQDLSQAEKALSC